MIAMRFAQTLTCRVCMLLAGGMCACFLDADMHHVGMSCRARKQPLSLQVRTTSLSDLVQHVQRYLQMSGACVCSGKSSQLCGTQLCSEGLRL